MPAQLEKLNRLHGRCRAGKVRQRNVSWNGGRAHARSGAVAPGKGRCGEGTSRGRGQTGLWGYLGDDIRRGGGGGRRHALVEARTHSGGYRRDACERYCDLLSIGRQCNIPPSMREAKIFQFTTATLPQNPSFCQYDRMVCRCGHRRVTPARTGRTGERLMGWPSCPADRDGVPAALRAVGQRRSGADPRRDPATGLGSGALRQPRVGAHRRKEPAAQAGRRCRQPHLHLQRASPRLSDGEGGDERKGHIITPCEYASRSRLRRILDLPSPKVRRKWQGRVCRL